MAKRQFKGSAFIEILMSIALFTAFAIPMYSHFLDVNLIQVRADQMQIASTALERELEDLRSADPDSLSVGPAVVSGFSELPEGQITKIVSELDAGHPSLLQITVKVSWKSQGETRQVSGVTAVNNNE